MTLCLAFRHKRTIFPYAFPSCEAPAQSLYPSPSVSHRLSIHLSQSFFSSQSLFSPSYFSNTVPLCLLFSLDEGQEGLFLSSSPLHTSFYLSISPSIPLSLSRQFYSISLSFSRQSHSISLSLSSLYLSLSISIHMSFYLSMMYYRWTPPLLYICWLLVGSVRGKGAGAKKGGGGAGGEDTGMAYAASHCTGRVGYFGVVLGT